MADGPSLSRRALITGTVAAVGAAAAAGLAAAFLGREGAQGAREREVGQAGRFGLQPAAGSALLANFAFQGGFLVSGVPQRLTFMVAGGDGAPTADVPDELRMRLEPVGGGDAIEVTSTARGDGVPWPYFPVEATFDTTGIWTATVEIDGGPSEQSFQVDEPDAVALLQPGGALPAVDTPTTGDARGVEPICTRSQPCPLHETTLTEALAERRPVALLVGTPAFCVTGLCGPVLELLLDEVQTRPNVRFLHAEVYANAQALGNVNQARLAPVVDALGMNFEPSLFVADGDGTLLRRLDNVYDRTELREALDLVA